MSTPRQFRGPDLVITAINASVKVIRGVTLDFMPAKDYAAPASFNFTVTSSGLTETASDNVNVLGVDIKDADGNSVGTTDSILKP
jgi:hypothetical protein